MLKKYYKDKIADLHDQNEKKTSTEFSNALNSEHKLDRREIIRENSTR